MVNVPKLVKYAGDELFNVIDVVTLLVDPDKVIVPVARWDIVGPEKLPFTCTSLGWALFAKDKAPVNVKDELKRILTKIVELRAALETEEGKAALAELEAILTKVSVEVVGPGVNKIADSVIEHSGQMAKNSTKAALAAFSATPLGIVLDIPTLVKNIASLAKNFTTLANELTTIIINMLGKSKESRNKFTEAFAKITNVIEKGNESLSNTLNTVQNNVKNLTNQNLTNNDYANNFANQNANNNANNNEKNNEKNFANQKGGLLNTYRQQAKMVGGRILQSKLEFLSSNVTKHKKTHKHINK